MNSGNTTARTDTSASQNSPLIHQVYRYQSFDNLTDTYNSPLYNFLFIVLLTGTVHRLIVFHPISQRKNNEINAEITLFFFPHKALKFSFF